MAPSGSVFSQTLKDLTNEKLDELAKKRKTFEEEKEKTLTEANSYDDPIEQLEALIKGVKICFEFYHDTQGWQPGNKKHPHLKNDLDNLDRFLEQARFDPSISDRTTEQWKQSLHRYLDGQSLRYKYADLYGKLTVEWLASSEARPPTVSDDEMDLSHDYEQVSARSKLESKEKWEKKAFSSANVDKKSMQKYLKALFTDEVQLTFKESIQAFEQRIVVAGNINQYSLQWVISGLLVSDLLTDEKRQVLKDFQSNSVILNEIADVLDMRMTALSSWSWGSEVPIEHRRRLKGTYDIYMHEDLLQAMFLQYIGVQWSVHFKEMFENLFSNANVWKTSKHSTSAIDMKRRDYFLLEPSQEWPNVQSYRQHIYRQGYFVSQLFSNEREVRKLQEGEEEAEIGESDEDMAMAMDEKPRPMASAKRHRKILYQDPEYDDSYKPKDQNDAKQKILHLLTADILIKTRFEGQTACFRSQFDSWNASLPHETILAVLEFFGVSQKWLKFFETFLRAPLRFLDDDNGVRVRKRGVPDGHVLSEVFGEAVLFCLDSAINQHTDGELLWRLHDDFWFWSSSREICIKSWTIIQQFNKVMGLSLNDAKTGSSYLQKSGDQIVSAERGSKLPKGEVRWGMLRLNSSGRFEIDRKMVDSHIKDLSKQLKGKERSVFAWIQAYSTYISVFFTTNFGRPANCFGRQHIDMMLSTHEHIQRALFATSSVGAQSVVEWLKMQIEQRFDIEDIPDGYLFFPTELGGLEVKSPFIGLIQVRNAIVKDPKSLLDDFEEEEKSRYRDAKRYFEERNLTEWRQRRAYPEFEPSKPDIFMPFEEFVKDREQIVHFKLGTAGLFDVYRKLLQTPADESVHFDDCGTVQPALNALRGTGTSLKAICPNWGGMDSYWQWVCQLYGPTMIEHFGGLLIVDPGLLPIGMVGIFKSGRVKWQE